MFVSIAGVICVGTLVTVALAPVSGLPLLAQVTEVLPLGIRPNQNLLASASYAIAIISLVDHENNADPEELLFTSVPSLCMPQLKAD